ncbi:MAG: Ribosomal RNA small subunit methyltransferase H [Candidatus Uhrbacteria bacterium GW2011_GWF2_41_16]|uniref:Ribosomal RNA small subunit methyltransferase H n=2 Tax=Candidatus Uhriibacteriota TaxID=1752732 RepID=A0A0G0XM48_9BACT|nr:MAG: Ribosomal RNA small subunit methyltransferase H [Candidatus Uhrbacteria bacterium GW2011_GWA2_41_10]KKR86678.1 MAG: Ribosomal RNA small subunit methyltransferase H [Candidatus Uhrbacteria bacterium GW2011_GWC2_41_11]KKR97870.1 MAG: Ribosomal RNA small subunit methyltransferase H [Candidatus Uhrbacteria bacterium GW2011_GWF2_41_16]HBP00549.1 16S rRNA (cytosine(1402)-N(4))-methyltransferase [Candidatus Uhrbacteria bacterium]
MDDVSHVPVLLEEVLQYLDPKPGEHFIDATVGQGGHAERILERVLPGGRLLAIDRDADNLAIARKRLARFGHQVTFIRDSYIRMSQYAAEEGFLGASGILLDLGFSSAHVDDPSRGFSFQGEGPLDMRYDRTQDLTAAHVVNEWSKDELVRIFRVYGEEHLASRIADAIVNMRREQLFATTSELGQLIEDVVPRHGKIHPATRVFQALRIAVNDELGGLKQVLPQAAKLLRTGGRLVVISFHSLEDGIVKRFFKKEASHFFRLVTKHVVIPSPQEIKINPRARSAKLRVAERI